MKDRVIGPKSATTEAVIIEDPSTGVPILSPEILKKTSLEYCVSLLTNRIPKIGFQDIIDEKNRKHRERMEETVEDDDGKLAIDKFNKVLNKVEKKNIDKYNFILKGGKDLKKALFHLYSMVWESEEIPENWLESELVQLYKGKGSYNNLNNKT